MGQVHTEVQHYALNPRLGSNSFWGIMASFSLAEKLKTTRQRGSVTSNIDLKKNMHVFSIKTNLLALLLCEHNAFIKSVTGSKLTPRKICTVIKVYFLREWWTRIKTVSNIEVHCLECLMRENSRICSSDVSLKVLYDQDNFFLWSENWKENKQH